MRLLLPVARVVLALVMIGFGMSNPQPVSVTLWTTTRPDVPLGQVVGVAIAFGALFALLIALVEGTVIRLANRRLRREIQRLETELNFARTQPGRSTPVSEPDESSAPAAAPAGTTRAAGLITRPVYGAESSGPSEDDEAYSGGRAV